MLAAMSETPSLVSIADLVVRYGRTEAVHGICTGAVSVDAAVAGLLSRPFKAED